MSFFKNLFQKKEDTFSNINWIPLVEIGQLKEISTNSSKKTQAIFKHSTRCGVSGMVIKQFEKSYALKEGEMDLYFLDLLKFRAISNAIASKFQVMHQSPQLIVIKDKKVIAHDSHNGILSLNLKEKI